MENFACGYCGASQIVSRSGGTVSLRLLSEGIKRVQAGTDKTAAELALKRLKQEYQVFEQSYNQLHINEKTEKENITKNFNVIWILISMFLALIATQGVIFAVADLVIWIGASVAIFYYRSQKNSIMEKVYDAKRKKLNLQGNKITNSIEVNRKIVA
jgi:hypothetical protein